MDGATSTRKFPAYTAAQLEAAVAAGKGTLAMRQEIADRKAGASVPLVVPQIVPDKELTLDQLIGIEDALDCQTKMTKEEFLGCVKQTPAVIQRNSEFWEQALALTTQCGTPMRAWNEIQRRIRSFHLMDQRA